MRRVEAAGQTVHRLSTRRRTAIGDEAREFGVQVVPQGIEQARAGLDERGGEAAPVVQILAAGRDDRLDFHRAQPEWRQHGFIDNVVSHQPTAQDAGIGAIEEHGRRSSGLKSVDEGSEAWLGRGKQTRQQPGLGRGEGYRQPAPVREDGYLLAPSKAVR